MVTFSILASLLLAYPETALQCDTATARALTEEARRDHTARQFESAVVKFRQAIEACPDRPALHLELANSLLMAGRVAEARSTVSDVLKSDPGNATALKIRANAEYLSGDAGRAIDTLIALLERYPSDEDGAYMLGRIYYQGGQIQQAVGQFQRVLRLNPQAYKAWDNLGLCWQSLGDKEKASAHFLKAISLVEKDHPDYDWAYANLAELLLSMEDNERAYAAAARAAQRNPGSARNFYVGAKALDRLGKTELCLNWLERSAALDPLYPEPQYLLMRVYAKLGDQQKSEQAGSRFRELKARQEAHKQAPRQSVAPTQAR